MSGYIERLNASDERKALVPYRRLRRIIQVAPSPTVAAVIARWAAWRAQANPATAR